MMTKTMWMALLSLRKSWSFHKVLRLVLRQLLDWQLLERQQLREQQPLKAQQRRVLRMGRLMGRPTVKQTQLD